MKSLQFCCLSEVASLSEIELFLSKKISSSGLSRGGGADSGCELASSAAVTPSGP